MRNVIVVPTEKKPYRFWEENGKRGLKLVVFATSITGARAYVASHALRKSLKYAGQGHPSNPESWCAALAL